MNDEEKITLLMAVRRACFIVVDAIENILHISPTTSKMRDEYKQLHRSS